MKEGKLKNHRLASLAGKPRPVAVAPAWPCCSPSPAKALGFCLLRREFLTSIIVLESG
jgi:hypothetical protein